MSIVAKTNVYIDGFNLYYRALKDTPYKWLDLRKLCRALLPFDDISHIRYFTALVSPRANDPNILRRQLTYIRALETIPDLTVTKGQFRPRTKIGPLITPGGAIGQVAKILITEEKGSDVNLATFLLVDGFNGCYEKAAVISNDSDLALPIEMVRNELMFPVVVINPNTNRKNYAPKELTDAATEVRRIRPAALRRSQFPSTLSDSGGTIRKPSNW